MTIDQLSEQAQAFAIACADTNSVDELNQAIIDGPDRTDLTTWGIDADEWRYAITLAIRELNSL